MNEKDKQVAHGIAYKYLDDTDSSRRLQFDIESALATKGKEAREAAFKDARYAIVDTPGSTHPNPIHRNGFAAGVNAAIQTLERAAATDTDITGRG